MDFSFLNEKQRQVVETLDQNILLLAPAGTGKTNTLACRIANILEKQLAQPEEIICLTFTNKACNEMEQRIGQMTQRVKLEHLEQAGQGSHSTVPVSQSGLESQESKGGQGTHGSQGIMVKTFHGFCYEILRQAAKSGTDLAVDFTVCDEVDCQEIIRGLPWCEAHKENILQALINLIKEYRGEYNIFTGDAVEDYDQVLQRLKSHNQARINAAAKLQNGDNDRLLMTFEAHCGEIISEYDRQLRENHGVDFCDLINGAYLLLQDESYGSLWRNRFKFWCVDEVQDTSRLEYTLLDMLFGQSNLLLCGDFFQTIYEWRGSEPQLIYDNFAVKYHPCLIVFHENYRSTQILLGASHGFLQNRFADQVAELFPEAAESRSPLAGEPVVHKKLFKTYFEAAWIYEKLQELRPANLSRVCILTRSNWYNQALSKFLQRIQDNRFEQCSRGEREKDFPLEFMLVDEFKFFRRQEIKDALAALKLLLNPQDSASLLRLLKRFGRRIGKVTVDKILSEPYKEAGIRLTDFLHVSSQRYAEPFEMLLRHLEQGQVVVFDVETTGLDTVRDEIIQIAAIKIDRQGRQLDRLMHYVRASHPVGQSEAVHHISDAMLAAEGLAPQEALQNFLDFAKGCVIVGHNVVFDLTMLSCQLARLGMTQLDFPAFYDTLDIFRRFYPKLPNYKLEFLGEHFQVQHKSSHDAFDDICATGEILIYGVDHDILPDRDIRRRLVADHIGKFAELFKALEKLRREIRGLPLHKLVGQVILQLGISKFYENEPQRLENLRNLVRQARAFAKPDMTSYDALQDFLRLTALSNTELDVLLSEKPKIPIITVHQAKGSEFDTVFLAGLQEGTFPSQISLRSNNLDEEARLFYVAITRARERLYLTSVTDPYGKKNVPCRFINAIPKRYIVEDRT